MTSSSPLLGIKARNISLDYEGKAVFQSLDFDIPAGEFVGLLGQSGIGKTTLLVTRATIQELAFDLLKNKTVLLVTHDPSEAARLCQRILVLKGQPAIFLPAIIVEGKAPRNYDDKNRIKSETELMHFLKGI